MRYITLDYSDPYYPTETNLWVLLRSDSYMDWFCHKLRKKKLNSSHRCWWGKCTKLWSISWLRYGQSITQNVLVAVVDSYITTIPALQSWVHTCSLNVWPVLSSMFLHVVELDSRKNGFKRFTSICHLMLVFKMWYQRPVFVYRSRVTGLRGRLVWAF